MAKPTVANPLRAQLFAAATPTFAESSYHKPFRVFPTGEAEYHWRIAALPTNQTISRHKSLSFALRKCTRLNSRHGKGAKHAIN